MIKSLLKNSIYYYTCANLALVRKNYCLKICYKQPISFLKYKISITNSLSNRLVIRSNYLRSYKNLTEFYVKLLRANFLSNQNNKYSIYKLTSVQKNYFSKLFINQNSIRNFEFLLLWRATQINSLFNVRITAKKKKKKFFYTHRVFFIKPERRILFVWKWLNTSLRIVNVRDVKRHLSLIVGFNNFFFATPQNHIITNFKNQIYKLHLLRNL